MHETCGKLENLLQILSASMLFINSDRNYTTSYLDVLFNTFRPKLSEILSISHVLCETCCDLYTPCCINEWEDKNSELFDFEIYFYIDIINKYKQYIEIDIKPYSLEEREYETFPTNILPFHTRLRQLYTIILDEMNLYED